MLSTILFALTLTYESKAYHITATLSPKNSGSVDHSTVGVSIEFFAFPEYTTLVGTRNCLAHLKTLRGSDPPVRIGGTTQDRALYDPNLAAAVNYTVASPADAPLTLTYGPKFFDLASAFPNPVTVGLNRRLNQENNTLAAGINARSVMQNIYAIELGNEPEYYAQDSPIIPSSGWSSTADAANEKQWFTDLASQLGNIFQGGVRLSWDIASLIPLLGSAIDNVKSFSRHSYPQSACGGASTNLPTLMNHSTIASYTSAYAGEAALSHSIQKKYFLAETNSATCGGGGISPTFGAALWIVDYVLQAVVRGVDGLYFHQGTIGNCAYCWWGRNTTTAPFYGASFVSDFLGNDGRNVTMLDDGTGSVAVYVVYSAQGSPLRALIYNSAYFDGTGNATSANVTLTGASGKVIRAKRLTASSATALEGATIGGASFDDACLFVGKQEWEKVPIQNGTVNVTVRASEAVMVRLA